MTTPEEAAIELHVRRLVDGYGLDEAAAREAVAAYRAGDMSAPTHFAAHRAAFEVLAALRQQTVEALLEAIREDVRRRFEHLRPLFESLRRAAADAPHCGEAYRRAALESQPQRREVPGVVPVVGYREWPEPARRPVARDRPAWETPYGPPARRTPRKR